MNTQPRDLSPAPVEKYGIGQPVTRQEDPVLVQGRGAYTDDVNLPGQVYAAFVRSMYAHGNILGIDMAAALAMPGVLAIYTVGDLEKAGYGAFKCNLPAFNRDGSPMHQPVRLALAKGKVRFVGDPVACVIATSQSAAADAAEAVMVDIESLPAVVDARAAFEPGAPQLYDDVPGNVGLDFHFGDQAKVAEAFAAAAHVTKLRIVSNRIVVNPMEPRSVLTQYDAGLKRFTIYSGTQGVVGFRKQVATCLNVQPGDVRVISRNVGGSFGMKGGLFPEYVCALHATRALGRPVKWTATRSESFLSDCHGRDHEVDAELALDANGRFLASRLDVFGNMGGYLSGSGPNMASGNSARNFPSVYATPLIEVTSHCMFTNTQPVGAYRGAGRPEANYYMERLIDAAAAELGIDKVELRRRNHIRPDQIPYKAPSNQTYDSGNFTAVLDRALEVSDYAGFAARKQESASRGRVRGIGIGQYLEVTGPVAGELGGIHFEPDGQITLLAGTHDQGQGHWSSFAQVVVEKLGVPFQSIKLMQTDSDRLSTGGGTGGSKSMMNSGTAFAEASVKVIEKGRQIAAHMLEASAVDIEFAHGRFSIAGTDRSILLIDIARQLAQGAKLPDTVPDSLDVDHVSSNAPSSFPNGCHVAEVEIDPTTGVVEIVKYSSVNDFGTIINPLLVAGQLHGGVMQGVGQVLMEHCRYSDDGQLISGSFMDYAMPRADVLPPIGFTSLPSPATTNPLGIKGCGEAGCAGSLSAVMNSIVDALSTYGIRHFNMPATPLRVWEAIREASRQ